jgi:gliding motility-associated-like protein
VRCIIRNGSQNRSSFSNFTFFIPNAFTPNGDEINEQFFGQGTYIKDFEMHIFDRWGNKIFESDDLHIRLERKMRSKGDIVMEDVYVWKVKVADFEGKHYDYNGHVSVVK